MCKGLILLIPVAMFAQMRPSSMEEIGKANLPAQKLGVDDLIAISVYDAPELTRTVRVESDGTIHLPMLSEGVAAAGLLPRELESSLVKALKTGEIMVDPVVKINVVEYHSRPIAVMGAVRHPLTFQAEGGVHLLDALARAEGLSPEAGSEILVTRRGTVERVPVKRLLDDADPAVNFPLEGGEEIRVPEAGKIFVMGNVRRPGSVLVHDPGDQTVLKLVAVSEGLLPYSGKIAYVVRHQSAVAQEIPVELDKIVHRKAPDMPLEAGDILYIPDNKSRKNTMNVLDRLTNFGSSTASGLVIWH